MSGEHAPAGSTALDEPPDEDGAPRARIPLRGYLLAVAVGVACFFAGFSTGSKSIPPTSVPVPSESQEQPTALTIPGDGTFWVGTDVTPGLYRSSSNADRCSWTREKDATGERKAVRAHDTSIGSTYVYLVAGEFFDTENCNTWRRVTQRSP
ncbi:hypothetical protein [Streptomyces mirabilis]|uniref:hypothetical protein n=1 Tax=Streptomyces mirabilis TaxID=68239 RepID=UPI003676BE59